MRRIVGRIVNGEYVRVDEVVQHDDEPDYFHGVAPSDLRTLSNSQLQQRAEMIYEVLATGVGTEREIQGSAEAYEEWVRERRRRIATFR